MLGLVGQQNGQTQVDPLVRTIETRQYQMKVAIDLGLWTVAFNTVDEMHYLLSKKRPTQAQLISYYSSLARILWMSSNAQQHQLFHAVCLLKQFNLVSGASKEIVGPIADQATLAVLGAGVADALVLAASESAATPVDGDGVDFAAEKAARLITLTGSGNIPTVQSLMSDLISKDVVSNCSETVQKLYSILTEDSSTKESSWLNSRVPELFNSLSNDLKQYVPSLARLTLVKVTKDMQSMYSCVRFDKFEASTKAILPIQESIRLLGQLKRTEQIDVCIDYQSKTIAFGSSSPSSGSGISTVTKAISLIKEVAKKIRAKQSNNEVLERAQAILFDEDAFFTRLEKERRRCEQRRNASDSRKDAIENEQVRKAQELADQLRKAEEERLEADARARAAEAARKEQEAKRREEELVKAKVVVERMVAFGGAGDVANLTDDQLVELGVEKLEQMQKDQFAKERQDRINKRRNESRRVEHTARLVRTAENERIVEWSRTVNQEDREGFAQMAAEKAEEWRKAAEEKKASVNALLPFSSVLSGWKAKQVDEYNHKLAIRAEERRAKLASKNSLSKHNTEDDLESDVAPTSVISRDEFKEMAKSLPSWKDSPPAEPESEQSDE